MRRAVMAAALLAALLAPSAIRAEDRDGLLREALGHGHQNRPVQGLELVRRVLAADPADVEARILEARLLAWAGNHAEAESAIGRVLADHPRNGDALTLAGDIAWYAGDAAIARMRYQAAVDAVPDHAEARDGLAKAAAARKPSWRVDMGADSSHFGPQGIKDWQDTFVRVGHSLSDTTEVHALAWNSHRFGFVDRFYEGGATHMFTPWLRANVAVGGTPAAVFLPMRRLDVGAAARIAAEGGVLAATWISLDGRLARYRTGNVSYLAPGIQQYLFDGQAWLTGRFLMMETELNKHPTGYEVRGDWQALERLRLFAGYVDVPQTTANVTNPDTSRFGGVVVGLTPDVDLTLSYSRGDPWRKTVGAALSVRF